MADLRDGDHSSGSAPGRSWRRRGAEARHYSTLGREGHRAGGEGVVFPVINGAGSFAVDRGRPLIGGILARTIANRVEAEARSRLIKEAMGPHER